MVSDFFCGAGASASPLTLVNDAGMAVVASPRAAFLKNDLLEVIMRSLTLKSYLIRWFLQTNACYFKKIFLIYIWNGQLFEIKYVLQNANSRGRFLYIRQ